MAEKNGAGQPFPKEAKQPAIRLKTKPVSPLTFRRLTTYLGAFIVLATFVVKDWQQEKINDQLQNLREARLSLSAAEATLRAQLESSSSGHLEIRAQVRTIPDAERYERILIQSTGYATQSSTRTLALARSMTEISLALGDFKQSFEPLQTEDNEESWRVNKVGGFEHRLDQILQSKTSPHDVSRLRAALYSYANDLDDYNDRTFVRDQKILFRADDLASESFSGQLKLEDAKSGWEFVGFCLFVLGWYLALEGKLSA